MGLLGTIKQSITGKPLTIKSPTFIKDTSRSKDQLANLEKLIQIAPANSAKKIEQDMKMLSYGIYGEGNVAYELKSSYMPILILHDLYLEYNGLTAQIDYVVIDTKFILIIECKNMIGDIEITSKGDFVRSFKSTSGKVYKKEGIYSPIVQNQRHQELIKNILIENMKKLNNKNVDEVLKSIVVLANPKSILNDKYAKKEIKNQIIKHDQLINHMKHLHKVNKDGLWFPEQGMYKVAEILMSYHKENLVDYTKKYNIENIPNSPNENITIQEIKSDYLIETHETMAQPNQIILEEMPIYKDLKEFRLIRSKEEGLKAYHICTNVQLEEIVRIKPTTIDELRKVKGFGEVKCVKYGEEINNIVSKFQDLAT